MGTILGHAKADLASRIDVAALPAGLRADVLAAAFPPPVVRRWPALVAVHPLAGPLVSTVLANELLDYQGVTFVDDLGDAFEATPTAVARSWWAARRVARVERLWHALLVTEPRLTPTVLAQLENEIGRLVATLTRSWLRLGVPDAAVAELRADLAQIADAVADAPPDRQAARREREQRWLRQRVPPVLAKRVARARDLAILPDACAAIGSSGATPAHAAATLWWVGERLLIDETRHRLRTARLPDRWSERQHHGLREDLTNLRLRVARRLLADGVEDPAAAATREAQRHAGALAQVGELLAALGASGEDGTNLHGLAVAVRRLREGLDTAA